MHVLLKRWGVLIGHPNYIFTLLHEALATVISPEKVDSILLDAVARAGLREIPESGSDVQLFVTAHLLPLVEQKLSHDARETVEETLRPILGAPVTLVAPPALEAPATGVLEALRETPVLEAPEGLPETPAEIARTMESGEVRREYFGEKSGPRPRAWEHAAAEADTEPPPPLYPSGTANDDAPPWRSGPIPAPLGAEPMRSPPVRAESGQMRRAQRDRRTLAEGGPVPTVVVASTDEHAIVQIHGALKGAALVRPAMDIAALADALCDGEVSTILIDNRNAEDRIANPRVLLAALDTTAVVLIWGEDTLPKFETQRATIQSCPAETSTDELSYLALALLPGEEEDADASSF